jgi:hypothetical protein
MAGNSKRKRKPGKAAHVLDVLEKARREKIKRIEAKNERAARLNNLPMNHPMNADRLQVFSAIDKMIDDEERTGALLFTQDGVAVMWEERMQDWVEVVSSLLSVSSIMDSIARRYTLGSMPMGLNAFALKVERGDKLNAEDRADARAAMAWIRSVLGKISPNQWAVAFDEYHAIEKRQQEQMREAA